MRFLILPAGIILFILMFLPVLNFNPTGVFAEEDMEVLKHSWHPTEKWDRIKKTRYAWHATVRSRASEQRKVSVYYYLVGSGGVPIAMNAMTQIIQPNETVEISGDSYLETRHLPFVEGSRLEVKSRPFP